MRLVGVFFLVTTTILASEPPTLKARVGGRFRIGAAIEHSLPASSRRLAARHFNTATPTNQMKWQPIQPRPGVYQFEDADAFVEWAEKRGMWIVGHTLIWHNQTPDWVFANSDREELLKRMREHIHTVVGRYRGRVQAWDVVNEALGDDGTIRRDSPWARIVGEDFIEHAFRYAHEADPAAELYYNDFNAEVPAKRDAMVALFHRLRAAGIRIDGLGHQAHVKLGHPTVQQLEECILKFHEAGAKVMFTELDVDVLPWPGLPSMAADVKLRADYQEKFNPYADALPPKVSHQLANRYAALFRLFVKHHDKIDRVTFWGVTDADSWLNNWPIKGRANYPLLFDRRGKPKPAFGAVLKVLGE